MLKKLLFTCLLIAFSLPFSVTGAALAEQAKGTPPELVMESEDGWYQVYKISDNVFAIFECKYHQKNYSYLIVGSERALMLDSGASLEHDITAVAKKLTDKPLSVLPTHLHFDHLGGMHRFDDVWLFDIPSTRELVQADGSITVPGSITLGFIDGWDIPKFKVNRFVTLGEVIDLGGVKLDVIPAPGHCKDEIVIYYADANMLFSGDYLYPSFLLSANENDYLKATKSILGRIDADTAVYGAHGGGEAYLFPAMNNLDVKDLEGFLTKYLDGELGKGEIIDDPRFKIHSATYFQISPYLSFITDIEWENGDKYRY